MSVASRAQFGAKKETTYGTPVTVDRFFEFESEKIQLKTGRVTGTGLRKGGRVARADRVAPYHLGAEGPVVFEVLSKGFGFWLEHMLGQVATAGPTDAKYTHTGTFAELLGKAFTAQSNRPFWPTDSDQAVTWQGCKIASWKLSNTNDGILLLELEVDAQDEATGTALATASYPSGTVEMFTFLGGQVTIGGSAVDVTDISISCNNNLKTDRRYLRTSGLKKEPVESGQREIEVELTLDWDSLTQYNRVAALTAAATQAQVVATWTAPTLIGAASFPTFVVTLPATQFDEIEAATESADPIMQKLKAVVKYDGTNSPVTIAYGTADATP